MTNYNFNYEELGFRNEQELKDSIIRVERRMKQSDNENEIERSATLNSELDEQGNINFTSLHEGARLEKLDRVVQNHILHEQEQAKIRAEQEELKGIFNAAAASVTEENEAKAQKEMQKEKEKFESEMQSKVYNKHNLKTDKERELDEALEQMLDNLN